VKRATKVKRSPLRRDVGIALTTLAACAAVVAVAVAAARPALASPADAANRISGEIMSPFCPGVTLHDCPSEAAVQLRAKITRWAQRGWGRDKIMAKLRSEYGPEILAAPPARGAGRVVWLLPGLAVAIGALVAWGFARRWTGASQAAGGAAGSRITPQERSRLESELAAYRDAEWVSDGH
jgi:cytochrome c-type biogenesis protein CcmH/NrfF